MPDNPRKFGSFEEMRQAIEGDKPVATCKQCGKPLKDAKFDTCYDCSQKQRGGQGNSGSQGGGQGGQYGGRPNGPGNFTYPKLPAGYLANGYFYEVVEEQTGSKKQKNLRDELITAQALELAKSFASIGLTTGQLRRFYSHVRYAAQRLEYGESFPAVRPAILELEPMVAGAVGRAKSASPSCDYELFKQFIDRNIAKISDKDAFVHGFVPHFQYIVAYFTYLKPKG